MNRRPTGSLSLSKAISGFLQYKAAEGLSPNTLNRYRDFFKIWRQYTASPCADRPPSAIARSS